MQNIRSEGTLPERIIMHELKRRKIYFAAHPKNIPGRPDIVFRRKKVAVFIDSDFWHGHPNRFIMPVTNFEYWSTKIARNKKRDRQVAKELREKGWKVIRLWEYDVRRHRERCLKRILRGIGREPE